MIHLKISRTGVFTGLLSLVLIPFASGQLAPTTRVPRNEALETYGDSPAPTRTMETSPRMISRFDSFTSIQVDVDGSVQNIVGDAANECTISVDPTNANKKVIAWRQ